MKTIHLAVLVASSAACAVQAQSSVAVYGVVDSALAYGHGSGPGASNRTFLTSGGNVTSRIGFRGVEDLGGGLSAGFTLEAQLFSDTGEGQPTNTNNQPSGTTTAPAGGQGLTFARRSTVSLTGRWGEVRLGRDFTAHYRNRVEVDPFGNAGVGAIQPFSGSIGGTVSTRASNMIAYFLPPNLGGIYGQVQRYLGENATGSQFSDAGTGQSIRLGYMAGPFNLSLAAGKTNYGTTATTGDITTQNIGLQYDLGFMRLMGGLYRDKVESIVTRQAKGYSIGGIVPVGIGSFKFALSRYGTDAVGDPETKKLSLGYVHDLSKRTAVYTTVARVTNSGGAAVALNQSVVTANRQSSGIDVGIRHAF